MVTVCLGQRTVRLSDGVGKVGVEAGDHRLVRGSATVPQFKKYYFSLLLAGALSNLAVFAVRFFQFPSKAVSSRHRA